MLYLDQNLALQDLRGGQLPAFIHVDGGQVHLVLQNLRQILSHLFLLWHVAVILDGQDYWVPTQEPRNAQYFHGKAANRHHLGDITMATHPVGRE